MSHPLRCAVEPEEVPVLFAGAELADAPPFDPVDACTTRNARPFILTAAPPAGG